MAYQFSTDVQHLTCEQVARAALAIVAGGTPEPKNPETPRSRRQR